MMRPLFKLSFSLRCSIASLILAIPGWSSIPDMAIIGGTNVNDSSPYAALVSPTGVASIIKGEVIRGDGEIGTVAINDSGFAIIGGAAGSGSPTSSYPYPALVSPLGVATIIKGQFPNGHGSIYSVAINNSGRAIVGGVDSSPNHAYAALVMPNGVAKKITGEMPAPPGGGIFVVDINQAGAALIGGVQQNKNHPYAAIVSPSGVAKEIQGPQAPVGTGLITDVAINNSGLGIIGGRDQGSVPYAAFITPSGVAKKVTGELPPGSGIILAVAINHSGFALIGGQDIDINSAYAAVVAPSGKARRITGEFPVNDGYIQAVAINNSRAAIIGGQDGSSPYAAIVSPSGVAKRITGEIPGGDGEILAVAINKAGVMIIGGQERTNAPYAALVSPLGIATRITGQSPFEEGGVFSVAISDAIVPSSFGPGNSYANSLFALSSGVLPNHYLIRRNKTTSQAMSSQVAFDEEMGLFQEGGLLVDNHLVCGTKIPCIISTKRSNFSLWGAGFGDFVSQDKESSFPAFNNAIAGGILGVDYLGCSSFLFGGGVAYAFNDVDLANHGGHAKINQELLTLYASWCRQNFFVNVALFGGCYQIDNTRHSVATITSTANINGWLLLPHIEVTMPFYLCNNRLTIDPFIMVDFANNWQDSFEESGDSGFNLVFGNDYVSMLRGEVGIRFFETFNYRYGRLVLQEKGSYVYKNPFEGGSASTFFVGALSSFAVETFSNQIQNLGCIQFNMRFIPCNCKLPYIAFNYQGEFGSGFQSNLVSIELGRRF